MGGGIKLISTATTNTAKSREIGKYFEDSNLHNGSITTGSKIVGFNNSNTNGSGIGKPQIGARVERGY